MVTEFNSEKSVKKADTIYYIYIKKSCSLIESCFNLEQLAIFVLVKESPTNCMVIAISFPIKTNKKYKLRIVTKNGNGATRTNYQEG